MMCDACDKEFKDGDIIIISKSAVYDKASDDYVPDGSNFHVEHAEECD